jgi:hypothetical protein
MFGESTNCAASGENGKQLATCPRSGKLNLPFEKYTTCCQVSNETNCENACPTIEHDGQAFHYTLSDKNPFNCACQLPQSISKLEEDYKRWPQTAADAIVRLEGVDDFNMATLQRVANTSGAFQADVVMTESKWNALLISYNQFSSANRQLNITDTIKHLDRNARTIDITTIVIIVGVIGVLMLVVIIRKLQSSSRAHVPVRRPSWQRSADSEISRLKRDPRLAQQRLIELEEE